MMAVRSEALAGVVLLLASVGTASAECAWILWRAYSDTYAPMASFEARGPCIDNIVSLARSADEKGNLLLFGPGVMRYKSEDGLEIQVHCFPDTIDPRGPKTQ